MRHPRDTLVAVFAMLASSERHSRAQAHYIWLTGESLLGGTDQPAPERTAGIVLSENAAGIAAPHLMTMFASGPKQCSAWMTDEARDHVGLPLAIASVGPDDAVLRSSPFTTAGPFTVEVQCMYGLFGHTTSDEDGLAAAPPLLIYYSSAQGGATSMYADVVTHEAQRSLNFSISVYHQAWMDREALAALSNASRPEDVDQCSPGSDASEPERVCVLAVVRFRGHLAAEPMTVFSYAAADQDPLSTIELPPTAQGVVAIWLPAKSVAPLFVRVMMDELTSGHSAEGDYSYKMHVATHAFLLPNSEPTSLAESQAIATQLDSITAEMVHAPLQWQDCGLQTDVHLLHMTQYSHSPDPIIDGSTRINRKTWRSSATWAIRNLTEIVTIYRQDRAGVWVQYFQNNFSPCDSHREHSDNAAHAGGPLCPICPGCSFTIVDTHSSPNHYYPTYRAVEHVWADGIFAGCATVVYHVAPSADSESGHGAAAPVSQVSVSGVKETPPGALHAVCHLRPTLQSVVGSGLDDDGSAVMYITSTVDEGTAVEIVAHGLNSSWPHGVHIHTLGNLGDIVAGTSAGAHYNPHSAMHGCARAGQSGQSGERKVGDLGNMLVDARGNGYYAEVGNMLLSLDGPSSVIGRSLVLHALPDNCVAEEGAAGDLSAGARIGVCTIGVDVPSAERLQHRQWIRREYDQLVNGSIPTATTVGGATSGATMAASAAGAELSADSFSLAHVFLGVVVGGVAGFMAGRRQATQGFSTPNGYTKAKTSETSED